MPTAAAGPISVHIDAVRTLLSKSATWRTWVEEPSEAAAIEHVYPIGLPPPPGQQEYSAADLRELRPFALVNVGGKEPFEFRRNALRQWMPGGVVVVGIEDEIPPEAADQWEDHMFHFLNRVGAVVEEMLEASEAGGFPVIQSVRVLPARRAEPDEAVARGDFIVCGLSIDFGLKG